MGQIGFAELDYSKLMQRGVDRSLLDERPEAIKAWLAELPLANLEEVARRLLDTLDTASAIGINPVARLKMLQSFEGTIDYLQDGFRKLYLQSTFPTPTRSRSASELSLRLSEGMTRGYRIVLLTDRRGLFGLRRRQRAQAAVGVCRHISFAILKAWLLYENPPEGTWQLVNATWLDAAKEKIHKRAVSIPGIKGQKHVDEIYKQLLLTDAAGPWHLPRGEVIEVFKLVGKYASHASLASPQSSKATGALFIVNPGEDRGVSTVQSHHGDITNAPLMMVTQTLLPQFSAMLRRAEAKQNEHKTTPDNSEAERLQRLITYLESTPQRRHERRATSSQATIIIGLNAIHRVLEDQQAADIEQSDNTTDTLEAPDLQTDDSAESANTWSKLYSEEPSELKLMDKDTPLGDPAELKPAEAEAWTAKEPNAEIEDVWTVVNCSEAGYCLMLQRAIRTRAQVGELVLVSTNSDMAHTHWQTGIVRWFKTSHNAETQIGIQLIAGYPCPVYARAEKAGSHLSEPTRCLLLPAKPSVDQAATLVTPATHFSMDHQISFLSKDQTSKLQLTHQFNGTNHFRQFLFQKVTSPLEAHSEADLTTRHLGQPTVST